VHAPALLEQLSRRRLGVDDPPARGHPLHVALNHAAVFVRVVDDGGFSAAARALRLPKSSVSRAVALLEEELGARLLQRSTRKVHLTEAGTAFYDRASRGLAGVEEAAAAVADLQGSLRGPIRVTAPADAGVWLIAPVVARFVALHPAVHVDVVLTTRIVDLVAERFDFALRAGGVRDSSLVARKLAQLDTALYAAPAYLARKGTPSRPKDLTSHDCLLFRPDRGRASWTLTGPAGEETVEVTGPVGGDDFSFLQRMVLAGVGIGLLPSFLCQEAAASGGLTRVLPEHSGRGGHLHLVYPSARYLPARAAAFRDFVLAALGES
jgi:DNA-binding transcriptional LysR family regulator